MLKSFIKLLTLAILIGIIGANFIQDISLFDVADGWSAMWATYAP